MTKTVNEALKLLVALRKESVDRNAGGENLHPRPAGVALRKESVDRNKKIPMLRRAASVALRKESVDRNSPAGTAHTA